MVQYARTGFDASFAALSDATRRGVLEQLGRADASITDLAEKFHMTLTGMKKHVGVLERAGLVTTEKVGRVRTCKLGPRRVEERRHGSRGTVSSGTYALTSWTRLSRN
jgi:DNA-binding transcriptional ArsR family regulator